MIPPIAGGTDFFGFIVHGLSGISQLMVKIGDGVPEMDLTLGGGGLGIQPEFQRLLIVAAAFFCGEGIPQGFQ